MVQVVLLAYRSPNNLDAIHDDIWIEIGHLFVGEPQGVIDNAHALIAKCLRYHSANGHSDPGLLKALALEALARAHPSLF